MRRNLYIAAFVAVLLIACIGGFVGGRVLLQRLQGDFTARATETPAPTVIAQVGETSTAPTQPATPTQAPAPTQPRPTSTVMVVPAPVTDQPARFTPEPTWTAGIELPTGLAPSTGVALPTLDFQTPDGTPILGATVEPPVNATPSGAYPFVLARSVRYSSGDCPGTYAQGQVTDRSGNPLAGVRLKLIDEFDNAAIAVTKPGPGDTGRYDFPMGGPARKFYISVVDDAGRTLSPEVEILHDLPPQVGKNCRWIDWRQR